jgi:hypothetical protein
MSAKSIPAYVVAAGREEVPKGPITAAARRNGDAAKAQSAWPGLTA